MGATLALEQTSETSIFPNASTYSQLHSTTIKPFLKHRKIRELECRQHENSLRSSNEVETFDGEDLLYLTTAAMLQLIVVRVIPVNFEFP